MTCTIAILVTCHDRKDKTLQMLQTLSVALQQYVVQGHEVHCDLFLTDDGCTDGTAKEVSSWAMTMVDVIARCHILHGDGNLFWAGGMRLAWQEALRTPPKCGKVGWDFFLLVNDDTLFLPDAIQTLMEAYAYVLEQTGHGGICSGIIINKAGEVIYGGNHIDSHWLYTYHLISEGSHPQPADEVHANSLLVSSEAVQKVGIFSEGYRHGYADFDYARKVLAAGLSAFVTSRPVGIADFDHLDEEGKKQLLLRKTLLERKEWFNHPLHSNADDLLYKRRHFPLRYPLCWLGRTLNVYAPHLYYMMSDLRRRI